MKNILVIGMIVVAMGFMVSIMFDKYDRAIQEQEALKQQQNLPKK